MHCCVLDCALLYIEVKSSSSLMSMVVSRLWSSGAGDKAVEMARRVSAVFCIHVGAVFCIRVSAVFCIHVSAVFCIRVSAVFCIRVSAVFCIRVSAVFCIRVSLEVYTHAGVLPRVHAHYTTLCNAAVCVYSPA